MNAADVQYEHVFALNELHGRLQEDARRFSQEVIKRPFALNAGGQISRVEGTTEIQHRIIAKQLRL